MADYYFDTSALVKLYVSEIGSEWVASILDAVGPSGGLLHKIAFSKIGIVEVAAAVARRERMGEISVEQRLILYARFLRDSQRRYIMLGLTDTILYSAARLTQRVALRSYDAVHLAAAVALNKQLTSYKLAPLTFVSADEQLCRVAALSGLAADNPNDHP